MSDNLKSLDLQRINVLLGGTVANEISRMEQERVSWMRAMIQSHSLAEQMKKMVGETSFAAQMPKQVMDLQANSLAEQIERLAPENSLAVQMAKRWQVS